MNKEDVVCIHTHTQTHTHTYIQTRWKRKWQPIPVFLPGKSYGQRSLEGYSPWSLKELDTTEQLNNNTDTHWNIT